MESTSNTRLQPDALRAPLKRRALGRGAEAGPMSEKAAYVTLASIIRNWPIASSARKHLIQEQPVGQCTAASGLAAC